MDRQQTNQKDSAIKVWPHWPSRMITCKWAVFVFSGCKKSVWFDAVEPFIGNFLQTGSSMVRLLKQIRNFHRYLSVEHIRDAVSKGWDRGAIDTSNFVHRGPDCSAVLCLRPPASSPLVFLRTVSRVCALDVWWGCLQVGRSSGASSLHRHFLSHTLRRLVLPRAIDECVYIHTNR